LSLQGRLSTTQATSPALLLFLSCPTDSVCDWKGQLSQMKKHSVTEETRITDTEGKLESCQF
jgi:hypothetical protein